ncbi:uncharacterized protein [Nicotiana sylvestris]|uniref:Uncharacterized protein LOC104247042 n=1 Tax=Nicotiana sylvestris TaxID=4096 RepID=A0A1U7YPW9_NICSY|nr:PREDICTED: uncharacterized protein LOC104247042 [Nicotiana sylvestris]
MDHLVDKSQSGFIPGRVITDNIILSHELVKGYGRKGISPRWKFVRWIMVCVKTISYSILINGKPMEPFKARRGLRQGDPLSPFLFVLGMEYLTRSFKTLKYKLDFNFHLRCDKLNIIQLGFADDVLLFCRGDTISIQMIFNCFMEFSKAFVLKANTTKSSIYFGGVPQDIQQSIVQVIGFSMGELSFKKVAIDQNSVVLHPNILIADICGTNASKKVLLSWDKVCSPKTAGGYNVMDVPTWNKVAIYILLWKLYKKKDKLWVQWIYLYYGKKQEVWETNPSNASWIVQKIIKAKRYVEAAGIDMKELAEWNYFSIKKWYKGMRGQVAGSIWSKLLHWQGITRPSMEWQREVQWAEDKATGNTAKAQVYRLTLAGAVYHIWSERNRRVFQEEQRKWK